MLDLRVTLLFLKIFFHVLVKKPYKLRSRNKFRTESQIMEMKLVGTVSIGDEASRYFRETSRTECSQN